MNHRQLHPHPMDNKEDNPTRREDGTPTPPAWHGEGRHTVAGVPPVRALPSVFAKDFAKDTRYGRGWCSEPFPTLDGAFLSSSEHA